MSIYTKLQSLFSVVTVSACLSSSATLIFDTTAVEAQIAKQYRVITDLRASASGQFSGDELYKLLAAIPANKSQIWIIDLRQESHGFIDGIPVSWYSDQNTGNASKSAAKIHQEENKLLLDLKARKTVQVYPLNKLGGGGVSFGHPVTMIPELIESEQELVTSYGAHYKRIYVLDHHKPSDQEVDQFINFVRKMKLQDWLHFHCRGGKGRSSTFVVMYDIIRNAHIYSLEHIVLRQVKFGNIQLDKLPARVDKQWKSVLAKERYEFLKKFHAYVIDPNGYKVKSWSSWLSGGSCQTK